MTSVLADLAEVDMAELLELTEETEEFRSITLPYRLVLFLNSWDRLILKIVSVGRVGLVNSKPPYMYRFLSWIQEPCLKR